MKPRGGAALFGQKLKTVTPTHLVNPRLVTESWLGPHSKKNQFDRIFLGELAVARDLVAGFSKIRLQLCK